MELQITDTSVDLFHNKSVHLCSNINLSHTETFNMSVIYFFQNVFRNAFFIFLNSVTAESFFPLPVNTLFSFRIKVLQDFEKPSHFWAQSKDRVLKISKLHK
jgi:hypothetical protein